MAVAAATGVRRRHRASSGSSASQHRPTSHGTARSSPSHPVIQTSSGATRKPLALAPFSARLSASGRPRSNQTASAVAIAVPVAQAQPTAIGRAERNSCQGAVAVAKPIAPAPSRQAPAISTRPGPKRRIAGCTQGMVSAPPRYMVVVAALMTPVGQPNRARSSAR